ncbi:MAG TPA: histidinol-phosphate transaminase [Terriglobales bacterium]|nr:histidinol-phosphate transaminase [Terriglobales bacterium]
MTKLDKLVPEHIRALAPYPPGKPMRQAEQESGRRCIKLASNENPFGPSPRAMEAVCAAAPGANFYPDNDSTDLRALLAERNRVPLDRVVVTAGSTSLLGIIARTFLGPGLNAVTSERSFVVYPIVTRATGARYIEAPMKGDAYDLDAILAAIDSETRVVFLANPNNPTGTLFDSGELDRFLDRIPDHVVVALDEAYCDFAEHFAAQRGVRYSHSMDYVRDGRNVVVLRTFSKAHGLAGLRVGYGFGPPALVHYFNRMRTTFSVSAVAQAAAMVALEDEAHVRKAVENNTREAPRLERALADLGFHVVQTWANFVYCELGENASAVAKRMQMEGVIIRPLTAWGAPTAMRVTVGTPEQNDHFLAAFKKVMERTPVSK